MNKIITFIVLVLMSFLTHSECSPKQNASSIEVSIKYTAAGKKAGGNHGYMDKVLIEAPVKVEGLSLSGMELTEGEVASFWIPLAYEVIGTTAQTEVSGYKEEIKNFEVAIYYSSDNCRKSIQRLLL